MTSAANKRLEVSRRLGVTERSPVRRARFGFVLLALAVLLVLQRAPASAQPTGCTGDCNDSGSVTVDELLKGINIALGTLPLSQCSSLDINGDGAVTVDEILIAVNNALNGCPTGELTFDKISLAVFPGGEETVSVTATAAGGSAVGWTVASSAPSIVSVVQIGSQINVTGVSLGSAAIMVTTQTGMRRSVPVRVYDPLVLDAGEILIRYTDQFECLTPAAQDYGPVSFYRPLVPEGWQRLGTFAIPQAGCPNINGQQWMMAVEENPEQANPVTPPLVAPTTLEDIAGISDAHGSIEFYMPECPAGYVAMGYVADSADVHDATCVRQDLTVPGVAGNSIMYYWATRVAAPNNSDNTNTTAYLETGTFTGPVDFHPILNVLAVQLPLLVDVPYQNWYPHLTGPYQPPLDSEPVLTKAVLVPFTAVLSGSDYAGKGVGWMVENSPFVRVERQQVWKYWGSSSNESQGTTSLSYSVTTGTNTTETTTWSVEVGISLTVESGVQFLGTGGKVSATVSTDFGWSHQTSISDFTQYTYNYTFNVPACTYECVWVLYGSMVVKMVDDTTGQLKDIASIDMSEDNGGQGAVYFTNGYPFTGDPPECP
jgi:hypothetical protein